MALRGLLKYAEPYRWQLALVAGLMLASSAVTLAVPWLAGGIAVKLAPVQNQSI